MPRLLHKPFASCSFTNLDFLIPQSLCFDCIISLLLFVLKILESKFYTSSNMSSSCFYNLYQ